MSESAKKRLGFISFIQFIGVLSVIYGHSMNSIEVPHWLLETKYWVYTYHMPLFFLVSAYLFSFYGGFAHKGGYKKTLWVKFERLILPYVIWNVLFIAPKYFFADYSVDHIDFTPGYFLHIMLSPRDNILGHTWFLFALFEMFAIALFFERFKANKRLWIPVTMILIVINCFGAHERFLAVGDLMKNGIYFWVGLLLGTVDLSKLEEWARDKSIILTFVFICVAGTIIWAFNHDGIDSSILVNTCFLGFSVILLLGIIQVKYDINHSFIEFVSVNSFAIYIMHWPILMVIRAVVNYKLHWPPVACMLTMFIGGLVIACGIAYMLRKMNWPIMKGIRKYVFGM